MITADLVKQLREKTGAGMMDCKKVLTETDGDMEKAAELLRERGIAKAAKKSDRIAAEGLVAAYVSDDKKVGSVKNPANVEELLAQKYLDTDSTVQEVLTNKIATIGENMSIRRFTRFESEGLVESYIHGDGKIGVLVNFKSGDETLAKDVCMQIAAARPEYLNREAVPEDRVKKEMEILKAQAMNEGKPAEIAEKMVQGRIGKFYGEICLLDQEFVKDPSVKVGDLISSKGAEIVDYVRMEKGEGLEKREENFAEEVMKQLK